MERETIIYTCIQFQSSGILVYQVEGRWPQGRGIWAHISLGFSFPCQEGRDLACQENTKLMADGNTYHARADGCDTRAKLRNLQKLPKMCVQKFSTAADILLRSSLSFVHSIQGQRNRNLVIGRRITYSNGARCCWDFPVLRDLFSKAGILQISTDKIGFKRQFCQSEAAVAVFTEEWQAQCVLWQSDFSSFKSCQTPSEFKGHACISMLALIVLINISAVEENLCVAVF